MANSGVYVAVFHLPRPRVIRVGRLGHFRFEAGVYAYVGSAQRNLAARLARHGRQRKRRHWHIDYLSRGAVMLGAMVLPGPKRLECEAAGALAHGFDAPIAGFGCSDCRCRAHLFRVL